MVLIGILVVLRLVNSLPDLCWLVNQLTWKPDPMFVHLDLFVNQILIPSTPAPIILAYWKYEERKIHNVFTFQTCWICIVVPFSWSQTGIWAISSSSVPRSTGIGHNRADRISSVYSRSGVTSSTIWEVDDRLAGI